MSATPDLFPLTPDHRVAQALAGKTLEIVSRHRRHRGRVRGQNSFSVTVVRAVRLEVRMVAGGLLTGVMCWADDGVLRLLTFFDDGEVQDSTTGREVGWCDWWQAQKVAAHECDFTVYSHTSYAANKGSRVLLCSNAHCAAWTYEEDKPASLTPAEANASPMLQGIGSLLLDVAELEPAGERIGRFCPYCGEERDLFASVDRHVC